MTRATVRRTTLDGIPRPGSTFRPLVRFTSESASVELGTAEVFERQPPEYFLTRLAWDRLPAATAVVEAAVAEVPESVHLHVNPAVHDRVAERRRLAADCGFRLFQEKEGFWRAHDGLPLPTPEDIVLRSMAEVGREPFRRVLADCVTGILDTADRLAVARHGPDHWAADFLDRHATAEDERSWLLAAAGPVVGFVGLIRRDAGEPVGTIAHIGVVPAARGRRISDQLLRAAHLAARERGFAGVLSFVDAANGPMLAAMRRAGVRADAHPWHKWHYVHDGPK
jgi:ribosomal protein S18 acetylase RimI-like enzyme